MHSVHHQSVRPLREHRVLIAMAVLAVVYCVAVPFAANLIAHFSY